MENKTPMEIFFSLFAEIQKSDDFLKGLFFHPKILIREEKERASSKSHKKEGN